MTTTAKIGSLSSFRFHDLAGLQRYWECCAGFDPVTPQTGSSPHPSRPRTARAVTTRIPRHVWAYRQGHLRGPRRQGPAPAPGSPTADRVTASVDTSTPVLILSIDGFPRKAYPLAGTAALTVGTLELALRPGDRDELRPLLAATRIARRRRRARSRQGRHPRSARHPDRREEDSAQRRRVHGGGRGLHRA